MKIAEGIHVMSDQSGMVNAGLIQCGNQVLVIDTLTSIAEGQRITDYAATELKSPVAAVILTHEHWDHTAGLRAFSAPIIASELTAKGMALAIERARSANPEADVDPTLPTLTFSERLTFHCHNRDIQIVRMGGHTAGSSYVFVPDQGVLFTGDIVVQGMPWMADADIDHWFTVLDALKALNPKAVVVGHGPAAGTEVIDNLTNTLKNFCAAVENGRQQGKTAEQITEEMVAGQNMMERRRGMILATVQKRLALR